MEAAEITDDIYWIGVNDRNTDLFEGMWPIPDGVSYNSYLLTGKTNVLVDIVKPNVSETFLEQLSEFIDPKKLDYIVLNHMEPDHTGILRTLHYIAPDAKFIVNKKTVPMLEAFYQVSDNLHVIEDGDVLKAGDHELKFFITPFLHWPETMMTYEANKRILFSCDAFGGYGAMKGAVFDDTVKDLDFYKKEALRYYSNIVTKYYRMVLRGINKLKDLPVSVIAPSHGLIWRKNPSDIVELYKKWASYSEGTTEPGITMIYGSMYGNTEKMMNAVARGVAKEGVPINVFNAVRTHPGFVLPSLLANRGVLVGCPTYEGQIFFPVQYILQIAKRKNIGKKVTGLFGSYGWKGGAIHHLVNLANDLRWEVTDTFDFSGGPTKDDLLKGEKFGRDFASRIKN
ncbi:MAG: FprA family A-type flavoprotein [Candidatus Hodarchaeales archaeon]|jgi:flavorubredoxin